MIDTSGYVPADVRASAELLRESGRYVFVSSVSAYADFSTGPTERSPVAELNGLPVDEVASDYSNYGPLKALCEAEVERVFGERALIVRPGLIVGPHDPSGRFTYWARRIERGGEILAPGPQDRRAQFVDVRDLAAWILDAVERELSGTFNATNEGVPWGELLAGATVTWVSDDFLREHEVGQWMELPLWLADPGLKGLHEVDVRRAVAAGLRFRPVEETIAGAATAPAVEGVGLTPEREAELLEAWRASVVKVAYPGREGAHSAAACALLHPDAEAQAAAVIRGCGRSRRLRCRRLRCAADRELGLGPCHRDARPARRLARLDQRADDSPYPALPRRNRRDSAGEDPGRPLPPRGARPVPEAARIAPQATAIVAGTTADAAAQVAHDRDPTEVAIASERAAALNGLVVLATDVGDHPDAYTRFVAVSNRTELGGGPNWRIAFSFQTDHQPGALHRAIEPFARHALDLVQLTSRPIPQTPWRYRFDAVVAGHPHDQDVAEALAEVRRQSQRFTVFGSYPA